MADAHTTSVLYCINKPLLRDWARWDKASDAATDYYTLAMVSCAKHAVEVRKPASVRKILVLPCRTSPGVPARRNRKETDEENVDHACHRCGVLPFHGSTRQRTADDVDRQSVRQRQFRRSSPLPLVEHDDDPGHLRRTGQLRVDTGRRRRRVFRHCRRLQDLAEPRGRYWGHSCRQQNRPYGERQHSGPALPRPTPLSHDGGARREALADRDQPDGHMGHADHRQDRHRLPVRPDDLSREPGPPGRAHDHRTWARRSRRCRSRAWTKRQSASTSAWT